VHTGRVYTKPLKALLPDDHLGVKLRWNAKKPEVLELRPARRDVEVGVDVEKVEGVSAIA